MASNPNNEATKIHLEEYKVISMHVIERVKLRHSLFHYTVLLMAAAATVGWQMDSHGLAPWTFLLFPLPFCLTAALLLENDLIISGLVNYHQHRLRKLIADEAKVPVEGLLDFESHLFYIREWRPYKLFALSRLLFVLVLPIVASNFVFWFKELQLCSGGTKGFGLLMGFFYVWFICFVGFLLWRKHITNPPLIPRFLIKHLNPNNFSVEKRPWDNVGDVHAPPDASDRPKETQA